jgi:hypothetical protein
MLTRQTLNARLPRTLRDTSRDPFDYIEHYRAPLLHRAWHVVAQVCFVVLVFGALGAAIAWGGRAL